MDRGVRGDMDVYLDCVNGANGDPGDGHAGKDVTPYLESAHG